MALIPRKLAAAFSVARLTLLASVFLVLLLPNVALAAAYFEDGYLGLTQSELREKLGPPHAVRDRKAALRVFNYYSFSDWDNYYRKLISPQNGEDVYKYTREGIEVRYSFSYVPDPKDDSDSPTLYVKLVDIEFSPSIPIDRIPALVPEFRPSAEPAVPSFRSNIWVLLFKGPPVSEARFIVRERGKERLDWSLAFQIFALQGLPEFLTLQSRVDRMEISAQSIQMVKERQRLTHEPILNPFSKEFANQAAPPPPPTKKIPVPKYAD